MSACIHCRMFGLHLEDSQEDMILTSSQCCQRTESVYPNKSSEDLEQVQKKLKCEILYIGVEQDN